MVVAREYSLAQQRIYDSMVALLGRAGLQYQGGFVRVGDRDTHYLDYGSGPPVVLVHGGGAGSAVWYQQIAALSKRFRVIAPDNPVFGLSERVAIQGPVPQFVSGFLASFLDALGLEKADFAGLSMGGFAGLQLALRSPERVGRLAILDASGLGTHLPWAYRIIAMPLLGRLVSRPNRWGHERFFAGSEVVNARRPDAEQFIAYSYEVTRNDGHWRAVRMNMPGFARLRGQRWVMSDDDLRSVKAETLVIWGGRDKFFPVSHAQRAAALIPSARLEVLPNAGHVCIWDCPDDVNRLLGEFFSGGA
jgi:pimeloyl-ACP methyl ester carboxylesterase